MNLELNPLQRDIIASIRSEHRVVSARCGWGAGKTSALVFAILFIAKWRAGTSTLLVTDTNGRYNSVLQPEMQKWLGPLGWVYNHTLRQWCDPSTGSTVWCRSYFRPGTRDTTHNPLEGLNITSGCCLIDECQTLGEEVAHKALGRLRSGPSPIMILVGLPVADAWWCRLAEASGCEPKLYTSYVNQDNLSDEWFEATKLLPEAEREAMVMNRPKPPSGLVYSEFNPETMVIDGWEYKPTMSARIAIDWGFRSPAVLFISHDPELEADVVHAEISATEVTVMELTKRILEVAWPRALQSSAPHQDMIWIDKASGDKAGAARNDQTALSAFRLMKREPPKGIGIPFRWTTDPIKTDILNGLQRLRQRFERDEILITSEMWDKGQRASHSLSKGLMSYSFDSHGKPIKRDEHHIDALRYDTLNWAWADSPIMSPARTMEKLDRRKLRRNFRPKFDKF